MKNLFLKAAKMICAALVIYSLGVSNAKKSCERSATAKTATDTTDTNYVHGVMSATASTPSVPMSVAFFDGKPDLSALPDGRPERMAVDAKPKWKPSPSATPERLAYIKRFAETARQEQVKYGIPASISLAQGIIESRAGVSWLAHHANNHFGIKCVSNKCKRGHCVNREDDDHKDFFRKYQSAWLSWRDHSKFLQGKRYAGLKKHAVENYREWAYGLKRAGYATDPDYAGDLISIIEEYDLGHFTLTANL